MEIESQEARTNTSAAASYRTWLCNREVVDVAKFSDNNSI